LAQASQPTAPAPQPPTNPLDNGPWLKLVENCVDLFDELDSHLDHFDPSGREVAEHTCLRLQEILQRCGVDLIDQPGDFDRSLHQPVEPGTGLNSATVRPISPGFRVGRRVLRRARVSPDTDAPAATPGSST
jgi:molecular chaperone GrpE (heat shock protein)